ncbi:hypothetical protein C7M84_006491 [Penaeus vannamei]|uniref:Uncharacterized protein n=1 Tax=Penaeus vannamei TaxID=6689 RepID=A0A423TEY1_PENVA|nr:hypothetical protein C7M84_006491 [Penaeus vannamei]
MRRCLRETEETEEKKGEKERGGGGRPLSAPCNTCFRRLTLIDETLGEVHAGAEVEGVLLPQEAVQGHHADVLTELVHGGPRGSSGSAFAASSSGDAGGRAAAVLASPRATWGASASWRGTDAEGGVLGGGEPLAGGRRRSRRWRFRPSRRTQGRRALFADAAAFASPRGTTHTEGQLSLSLLSAWRLLFRLARHLFPAPFSCLSVLPSLCSGSPWLAHGSPPRHPPLASLLSRALCFCSPLSLPSRALSLSSFRALSHLFRSSVLHTSSFCRPLRSHRSLISPLPLSSLPISLSALFFPALLRSPLWRFFPSRASSPASSFPSLLSASSRCSLRAPLSLLRSPFRSLHSGAFLTLSPLSFSPSRRSLFFPSPLSCFSPLRFRLSSSTACFPLSALLSPHSLSVFPISFSPSRALRSIALASYLLVPSLLLFVFALPHCYPYVRSARSFALSLSPGSALFTSLFSPFPNSTLLLSPLRTLHVSNCLSPLSLLRLSACSGRSRSFHLSLSLFRLRLSRLFTALRAGLSALTSFSCLRLSHLRSRPLLLSRSPLFAWLLHWFSFPHLGSRRSRCDFLPRAFRSLPRSLSPFCHVPFALPPRWLSTNPRYGFLLVLRFYYRCSLAFHYFSWLSALSFVFFLFALSCISFLLSSFPFHFLRHLFFSSSPLCFSLSRLCSLLSSHPFAFSPSFLSRLFQLLPLLPSSFPPMLRSFVCSCCSSPSFSLLCLRFPFPSPFFSYRPWLPPRSFQPAASLPALPRSSPAALCPYLRLDFRLLPHFPAKSLSPERFPSSRPCPPSPPYPFPPSRYHASRFPSPLICSPSLLASRPNLSAFPLALLALCVSRLPALSLSPISSCLPLPLLRAMLLPDSPL